MRYPQQGVVLLPYLLRPTSHSDNLGFSWEITGSLEGMQGPILARSEWTLPRGPHIRFQAEQEAEVQGRLDREPTLLAET